ncbi:peptidase S8 [Virgisporangium aurantiacum]|uniref:Peptidase S8 n=1 Tax=Virgisporangium aurantiacum TaxID=175570 RepID=A0A8J3Z8N8_9ACTN|nr:peptidase S8 [Virgisporangium aurantiacum]
MGTTRVPPAGKEACVVTTLENSTPTAGGRSRPGGRKRLVRLAAVGLLIPALAVFGNTTGAGAAPATKAPFTKAPAGLKITNLPLGVKNKPVTVVVELAGDPVAVADANAATPLTQDQKRQHQDRLRQEQAPVAQHARNLGGTVLGTYQHAYNGIKVRIPAGKAPELASAANVVAVHPVQTMKRDNVRGVPLIGAPAAWNGAGNVRGEGIKVAIIDTGIDWTHADFGGPGTPAAYAAAHAAEAAPADPRYFGPNAPKVKGGIDLVGDSYNADPNSPAYQPVPHPDPNPLDCNGHGTHVAGTAAGFGVTSDGRTFTGPYNADTVSSRSWNVGPGVAPKADLYGIRVFGCEGSTDVTVDAIEWAVANDMDVINMSLGSPFGSKTEPSAVAADNAAKDGVIVVASAGNEGPNPYMVGSPSTGTNVISVAANDPTQSFPGATLTLSTGATIQAINANGAPLPSGPLPIEVLRNSAGGISLGCDPAEYTAAGVAGKLVVVQRGTCARVARAIYGQQAGAAAVLMVNSTDDFPPFEGPITANPDTGEPFTVTIPFLGVPSSSGPALVAADGGTATLASLTLPNPGYLAPASFSSGGPRSGDSWLKPDVTAPGVSIFSAGVGTGNNFAVISGTSMAAPHTAGMAALVRQAHPGWRRVQYWKAAIVNTADPGKVTGYSTRIAGSGLIQAPPAVTTEVVALGDVGTASVNFGFAELDRDFKQSKVIVLRNFGNTPATFNASVGTKAGSPHSTKLSRTRVTVPARGETRIDLSLSVTASTAGTSAEFADVAGLVTFTPANGNNHGVALRVPYYMVPQAVSNIETKIDTNALRRNGSAVATVTNRRGVVPGAADWYAWGLYDSRDRGLGSNDMRAVGAQTFPGDGVMAFAISTTRRWSNASTNEFDVYVDVNGDGVDDYVVVGVDLGLLTAGEANGEMAVAVFDLRTGDGTIEFLADAPTDSSTLVLPVLFEQLCAAGSPCLSAANPRLKYHAVSFGQTDNTTDTIEGVASFNAFTPAISTGMFDVVAPNASASETVTINAAEFALTPPLGLMIVSHDNRSADEAQLIPVRR